MKLSFLFIVIMLFSYCSKTNSMDPEINGLVLDRSVSRFGKTFYREFFILWQEINTSQGFNAVVLEKNIPRSGTVLWVEVNGKRVFQTFFGRRQGASINELASQAAQNTVHFVMSQVYQEDNPDIASNGY